MASGPSKESEGVNEVETKVDTVDYQTLPGQGQTKRDVQIIHQSHPCGNSTAATSVVASAASAAGAAVQAAKDAVTKK